MSDYYQQSTDYRRGFVEGQSAEPNAYLLQLGTMKIQDYWRGYREGFASVNEIWESNENSTG